MILKGRLLLWMDQAFNSLSLVWLLPKEMQDDSECDRGKDCYKDKSPLSLD